MDVPQSWISRREPTAPGGRLGDVVTLVPDDLPPHQKAHLRHALDDKGVQGDIWLSPQVGDIDAGPASRDQHTVNLPPDPVQEIQVFIQGVVLIVFLANIVGRGGHH